MSRMTGDHFSESITFEADGLEDILRQVREARTETDLLHSSQVRAGSAFGRMGLGVRPPGFGPAPPSVTAAYRPRPAFGGLAGGAAAATAGLSTMGQIAAEANYQSRAAAAARMGLPIPLASGRPVSTYGLQTDTISDQSYKRRRGIDANRLVSTMSPEGPSQSALPAQGIASWERMKRNAEQYQQALAKVGKEYEKAQKSASRWFHGDPMTRQLRENGAKAIAQAKRDADAAEAARRRSIGFRGRVGEDWHGHDGQPGLGGRLRHAGGVAGNLALGVGVGAFGLGMAGLQGTVTGNRFNNEFERTQRELGNAFGPALKEATRYLEDFNSWLSKLSPSGQRLLAAGGIAAAGYAGLRAVGLGGAVHSVAGGIANAGFSAASAYGPGALRAIGGGSMLMGGAIAGSVAYGAYQVARGDDATNNASDFIRRVREGKNTAEEAASADPMLRAAHAKAGGREAFERQAEERRVALSRQMFGRDAEGNKIGTFTTLNARGNMFLRSIGLTGKMDKEYERSIEEQKQIEVDKKLRRDGKLGVGGGHNVEPIAGGGFESFMQTYQRLESAFGKIDKGQKELEAANIFLQAAKLMMQVANGAQVGGGGPIAWAIDAAKNAAVPGMAGGAMAAGAGAGGAGMIAGNVL